MLVQDRPSKDIKELSTALAHNDALFQEYEQVSVRPLTDEIRLMATRAVLTKELALKAERGCAR